MVIAGVLRTNRSPFSPNWKAFRQSFTASSSVMMNRVMSGSVMVIGWPRRTWFMNSGTTDPREASTLP